MHILNLWLFLHVTKSGITSSIYLFKYHAILLLVLVAVVTLVALVAAVALVALVAAVVLVAQVDFVESSPHQS